MSSSQPKRGSQTDPLTEAAVAHRKAREELEPLYRAYRAAADKSKRTRKALIDEILKEASAGASVREIYFRTDDVWTQENIRKVIRNNETEPTT